MWLSDKVEIDDRLLDAHREGKLVIFVGAGASMGSPSDLPDFKKLTQEICKIHGTSLRKLGHSSRKVKEPYVFPYDLVLARLGSPESVKKALAKIIGRTSSAHTDLHEQIMRLSCSGKQPKVVTTNYDSHLTAAAKSIGFSDLEVFHAPALPLGRNFEGVVHVHGSLERDLQHLVLTRTDFGHAYLTDGWATKFLYEMFANFTVLFIGYSHRDLIVDYLARGLGKKGGLRFALTEDTNHGRWRELGITPINYDLDAISGHRNLLEAIRNWADLVALGASGLRVRIRDIVERAPSLNRADNSLIQWAITDSVAVNFVCEFASGADWIDWMVEQESIKAIFEPGRWAKDSAEMIEWFVEKCILDPLVSGKALETIMNKHGIVGDALWFAIAHGLMRPAGQALILRDQWITWLVSTSLKNSGRSLSYLILDRTFQVGPETSLQLWSHLTRPALTLKPTFSLEDSGSKPRVYAQIEFGGDDHSLLKFWESAKGTLSDENVWSVLQIADSNLSEAQRLDRGFKGLSSSKSDIFAIRRPAIEDHDQNSLQDAADVLIDAARDALCFAFSVNPNRAMVILESWLQSGVQIIRRIGWHCLGACSGATPVDIVTRVLNYKVLNDSTVHREVYQLLRSCLPEIDDELIKRILEEISNLVEVERHAAYSKFDLLNWMHDSVPESQDIGQALGIMQERHPSFVKREHADFNSWGTFRSVVNAPIWSAEDFVLRIRRDVEGSLTELLQNSARTSPFDMPRWEDSLTTIFEGVRSNPGSGLILWHEVVSKDSFNGQNDVAQSIIQGWNSGELSKAEVQEVIQLGLRVADLSPYAHLLSIFLVKISKEWEKESEQLDTQNAEELAQRVLDAHVDESIPTASISKAYEIAINDSCGHIAEFYLYLVSAKYKRAGDDWSGIPDVTTRILEDMIGDSVRHSALVLSVFTSQINFLQTMDAAWTSNILLPVLRWERDVRLAPAAWSGFLVASRWNEGLLSSKMLASYLRVIKEVELFSEEQRERTCQHLAAIALFSVTHPGSKPWLKTFMAEVPHGMRVMFVDNIAWNLQNIDSKVIDKFWNSWLRDFWQRSLLIDSQESDADLSTALAGWAPLIGSHISEIVLLVGDSRARLDPHSLICSRLISSGVALNFPEQSAQILLSLLRSTAPSDERNYDLQECVEVLHTLVPAELFRLLVNAALNAGYREAISW